MDCLLTGAVEIMESSLKPTSDICNVLGIGVAVNDRICTSVRRVFNFSFCLTPKCCSSSIIKRPNFLKFILSLNMAWVPIRISTSPFATLSIVSLASLGDTNLDN